MEIWDKHAYKSCLWTCGLTVVNILQEVKQAQKNVLKVTGVLGDLTGGG